MILMEKLNQSSNKKERSDIIHITTANFKVAIIDSMNQLAPLHPLGCTLDVKK